MLHSNHGGWPFSIPIWCLGHFSIPNWGKGSCPTLWQSMFNLLTCWTYELICFSTCSILYTNILIFELPCKTCISSPTFPSLHWLAKFVFHHMWSLHIKKKTICRMFLQYCCEEINPLQLWTKNFNKTLRMLHTFFCLFILLSNVNCKY